MLKIAILGDLIQTPEFGIDPQLQEILQSTDLNIANLEAPFIGENCRPSNGRSGLCQKIEDARLLKELNIKIVSLANNHICDFGREGLRLTKDILDRENILYFGAGESLDEACRPVEIEINGIRISLRGAMSRYLTKHHAEEGFGTADIDAQRMIEDLKADDADIKIIYNHWNQEFEDYPEPIYKDDAETLIDHAHIIAGSHSHCIQGIDIKNDRPIFYGLGNFSLPNIEYYHCRVSEYRPKSYRSFFPVLKVSEKGIDVEIIPYQLSQNGAVLSACKPDEDRQIKEHIDLISKPLALDSESYGSFYLKHRERKMRMPLVRDHGQNEKNLKKYRRKYRLVHGLEKSMGTILDKLGLRKAVKTMFRSTINKIQKTK